MFGWGSGLGLKGRGIAGLGWFLGMFWVLGDSCAEDILA